MTQRVVRIIDLLFQDHGTRRAWVISNTLRPYLTPRKDPVPIVQEAGWASGRAENLAPPGFDPWTVQPVAQSLYRLSYPTHTLITIKNKYTRKNQYKNTVQTIQNTVNTSSGRTEVNRDKLVVRADV